MKCQIIAATTDDQIMAMFLTSSQKLMLRKEDIELVIGLLVFQDERKMWNFPYEKTYIENLQRG